jgi:cysteine desulfurase
MIYADYNGSAPLLPAVKDYLHKRLETNLFANPNAIHSMGQKITQGIEKCRAIISEVIGCDPSILFFNSGSSEGLSQIHH